ncbi:MAG: InlB B-repeat-containing protein, partial [Clostridia bacterium]|nr:InlB B-repeat-containing protein [Clostridia bacterium]
ADGGTPVPADAEDLIAGEKVDKPADPTKEGYRFVSWQINGADVAWDTNDQYTVVAADDAVDEAYRDGVIEMVAQWSRIYTVVFDLGTATDSGHTPPADVTVPESKTGEAGAKVPQPDDPVWDEGHHFDGWQINGTDVYWVFNDSDFEYEIDANDADADGVITMVAQWITEKYSVTFNTNGADTPTPFIDPVYHGDKITKPADPEKTDYFFNGWFIDKNGNNTYDEGVDEKVVWDSENKYTVTEAVTMTADWTDQFAVTFYTLKADASGYEVAKTAVVSTEGYINQADVPVEGTDFDHVQGYSFENEWYLTSECTGTPVDLNGKFTTNTDVYAKYVVIKLVPFDANSTAMIERTTTAGTPLVETYTGTVFGRRGPAVTATITNEYGDYSDDCSKFFVYGLKEDMTEAQLRAAVKAQGVQGDIRVTSSDAQDGKIGTGTVIEVIDTVVNEPVETFHVVIFGDVTGDAIVDNTDYSSLGNQVTGSGTALSWDPVEEPWTQRAANINGDSVVNNADYSRLNYYFSNISGYEINQIKGLVNTKPAP